MFARVTFLLGRRPLMTGDFVLKWANLGRVERTQRFL
jgi:hypothetical protein